MLDPNNKLELEGTTITLQQVSRDDIPVLGEPFVIAHKDDAVIANFMKDVPLSLQGQYFSHTFNSLFTHEAGAEMWKIVNEKDG